MCWYVRFGTLRSGPRIVNCNGYTHACDSWTRRTHFRRNLRPIASLSLLQTGCWCHCREKMHYSQVMGWLRCRTSFALIRSAIMAIRGSRSKGPWFRQWQVTSPLPLLRARLVLRWLCILVQHVIFKQYDLSCFCPVSYIYMYVPSSRWQPSQLFSHLRCTKLFGEVMSTYAAFNGELHADYVDKLWFCNNDDITLWSLFGGWNIGGLLSKLPIRQNKFPAKISSHTVYLRGRKNDIRILDYKWISG